jgi:membrane-associated phospholipid phosphatase
MPPPEARRPAYVLPLLVGAYLTAVTLFMVFVLHLSVSPERLLLLMLIAALVLGRTRLFLADWVPFLVLFLSYEYLRGISTKAGFPVHDVTWLEPTIGGRIPTVVLQSALYHPGHVSWYDIAATMFYFLHFAFPLAVGYLFWIVARPVFLRYSRTLIAMSFAAFLFYLLLPVEPPWMALPHTVVKLIEGTLPSFTDLPGIPYPATVYHFFNANPVAAMPSMHAAYPFLGYLFAARLLGWRALPLLAYTMLVWISIVYLGEHYVIDIVGGVIFAFGAFFGEDLLTRWWRNRHLVETSSARSSS